MDRDAIRSLLLKFINGETSRNLTELADEVSLRDEVGLDSLDMTGILLRIEDHYGILLTRPELKDVHTVGQLLDLLEAKLAEGNSNQAAA